MSPQARVWTCVGLSVFCYALFLFLPFVRFSSGDPWLPSDLFSALWPGLLVVGLGWLTLFGGYPWWLANPLGAVSLVLLIRGRYRASGIWAGLAMGLALSVVKFHHFSKDFSGGGPSELASMGAGFFAWIAAIASCLVGAAFGARAKS